MKKVISILLVVLMVFALVGCSGTKDLQTEVDALKQSLAELQATVSSQNQTITAQTGKIAELESAKAAQAETIAALQNSAHLSAEEIAALEAQLAEQEAILNEAIPKGAFCSVQTAYANGWLSKENLNQIATYYNKPSTDNAQYLDAVTLYAIKQTYIETEVENSPRTVNDLYLGRFYGKYGKCLVLCLIAESVVGCPIKEPFWREEKIGGITFKNYCELSIYVWYPLEG